jgi:uncharacterized protein YkwD
VFGLLLVALLAACGTTAHQALRGRAAATTHAVPAPRDDFNGRPGRVMFPPATPTIAPPAVSAFAAAVIGLTNQERVANGCAPLTPNPTLMGTALAHSADMAEHHFFAHTSSSGQTPAQRIQAAGYNWVVVAENIAAGYATPESVNATWFDETPPNDPHRANILDCRLRDIGVGYYYLANDTNGFAYHFYWTEDFGTLPG